MWRTLVVLAGWVAVAHADRVRMPVSGFDVDLPGALRVGGVARLGAGTGEYIPRDQRPAVVVLRSALGDIPCAAATAPQAGEQPFVADWLPAGWRGKQAGGLATLCAETAGFPVVLLGVFDARDVPLLRAFDRAWKTPDAMAPFETIELPASRFRVVLPPGVELVGGTGADELWIAGARPAPIAIARVPACDAQAIAQSDAVSGASETKLDAHPTASREPAPSGWRRFALAGDRSAYCSTTPGPVALVVTSSTQLIRATGAADPTPALLASLAEWLPPVTQDAEATRLPLAKLRVRLVTGWSAKAADRTDVLVRDGDTGLAAITEGQCGTPASDPDLRAFDPAWLPRDWHAWISASRQALAACTEATSTGKARVVAIPFAQMPPVRELPVLLEAVRLAIADDPPVVLPDAPPSVEVAPAPRDTAPIAARDPGPRGPLIPFPFELAYQTVGTATARGHGARLGLHRRLGDDGFYLDLFGELGWDTLAKLSHDVQVRAAAEPTDGLEVAVAAGHDAFGSGADMPLVHGELYLGLGAALATSFGHHGVRFDGAYLWRFGADETRFALTIGLPLGPLQTIGAELRMFDGTTTILVGSTLVL